MYVADGLNQLLKAFYGQIGCFHRDKHIICRHKGIYGNHPQRGHTINQNIVVPLPHFLQELAHYCLPAHDVHKRSFQSGKFNICRDKVNPLFMADDAFSRPGLLVIDDLLQNVHQCHIQLVRLRNTQAYRKAALRIGLHQQNLFPRPGKPDSQIDAGCCLPHSPFLVRYGDNLASICRILNTSGTLSILIRCFFR